MSNSVSELAAACGLTTEKAAQAVLHVEMLHWNRIPWCSLDNLTIFAKTFPPNMICEAVNALPVTDPFRTKYTRWITAPNTLYTLKIELGGLYHQRGQCGSDELTQWRIWYDPNKNVFGAVLGWFDEDTGEGPEIEIINSDPGGVMAHISAFLGGRDTEGKIDDRGRYRERMAVRISRRRHPQYEVYTLGHQGNDIITVTARRASDDRIQKDWYLVRNGSLKTMTEIEQHE
jgi:hypothetical protein